MCQKVYICNCVFIGKGKATTFLYKTPDWMIEPSDSDDVHDEAQKHHKRKKIEREGAKPTKKFRPK